MPALFFYILKLSISLFVVFLFYQLILRRLTFYNYNRWYLLAYSVFSFFIPFIDISQTINRNRLSEARLVDWVPLINNSSFLVNPDNGAKYLDYWFLAQLLVMAGILFMLLRLVIQLLSFIQMMKKAKMISDDEIKIYQVNESVIPFSFGNSVFVNPNLHSAAELKEIIRHEFVHVKQRHSLDIILGEILCIVNWYNPFAWLLKKSIRQNLEFIADRKVVDNGLDRKQYQFLLLKVIGNNHFSIAPKFNFSSLKKRIAMMNKVKSARLNLVRFLFILPLIAILLLAFRNKTMESKANRANKAIKTVDKTNPVDTVPKSSPEKISIVSDDYEISDQRAVIHLKDGTTEEYDLKNKEQKKNFEGKYGKIISVNEHKGPMATVSAITDHGVVTAIAPVSITSGSGQTVTSSVTTTSSANGVTLISPVASTESTVAVIDDNGYTITGNEDVLITIKRNATPEQLEGFKKQMKEKGIELNYDKTTFNKGLLTHIDGTMKSSDGSSSRFSATDFSELILAMIKDGDRTYFKVSVKENKKTVI